MRRDPFRQPGLVGDSGEVDQGLGAELLTNVIELEETLGIVSEMTQGLGERSGQEDARAIVGSWWM